MSGRSLNVFMSATSVSADITSEWQDIEHETTIGLQADFGIVTGTLTVEGRVAGMDAVPITDVAFNALAGVAGSQLINVNGAGFAQFRVKFVYGSGIGALKVGGHAKRGG